MVRSGSQSLLLMAAMDACDRAAIIPSVGYGWLSWSLADSAINAATGFLENASGPRCHLPGLYCTLKVYGSVFSFRLKMRDC